jgi:hypothetical protein
MALTDPTLNYGPTLGRNMFQRQTLPGVDPTQSSPNRGGITETVAAQPIQVASGTAQPVPPPLVPPPPAGFVNWVSGFTEQDVSGVSLDKMIELWNAPEQADFRAGIGEPPPEVIPEGWTLAEDGRLVPLADAEVPIKIRETGVSGVSDKNLALINNAAATEVAEKVNTGEITPADAANAETNAQTTLDAVIRAEDNLQKQLTVGNLGTPVDLDIYQAQAKKLLGVDEDETDVPDWAAPMFLFGLNLMKGPVSSKTEGQGLVGGLLSDLGAAGEKSFAFFATERARKRKDRAAIATMAFNLKKVDDATRTAIFTANLESKRWWATFGQKNATENRLSKAEAAKVHNQNRTFFAAQDERIFNRFVKDDNPETMVRFSDAWNAQIVGILNAPVERGGGAAGVRKMYENPAALSLAGSFAAKTAGLTPEFKTETIEFGAGAKLTYSVNALNRYARTNKSTPGKILNQITNDPHNAKWAGIALAINMGKDQIIGDLIEQEGIVTPSWIDTNLRTQEVAAALEEKREVDPSVFTKKGTPYLKDNQDMKKIVLGNVGGVEKYAYVNIPKLALINAKRRKAGKNPLDLIDILKSPTKAAGVVSKTYSDTSGALNNLSTVEINVGEYETQDFLFNKNILDSKRKEIAEELGIEESDVDGLVAAGQKIPWEVLLEVGVFTPLGEPRTHKKPITKTVLGADGTLKIIEAPSVGEIVGLETAQARAELNDQIRYNLQANASAFTVKNIFSNLGGTGITVASKWTDIGGKVAAAGRMLGITGTPNLNKLYDFNLAARSTSSDRERTNNMIKKWSDNFDAAGLIKNVVQRQRLKSLFIDMAFNMASAREKGKLTDKDVDWAFRTLGFDTEAYLQNPEKVLAGLNQAMATVNRGMEFRIMQVHEDAAEIIEYNKNNPDNKRYALEEILRARWGGIDPGDTESFYTNPDGTKIYRFDRVPGQEAEISGVDAGGRPLIAVDQSRPAPAIEVDANLGFFTSRIREQRIPIPLFVLHNALNFPGGTFSAPQSPADMNARGAKIALEYVNDADAAKTKYGTDREGFKKLWGDYTNFLFAQKLIRPQN